MIFFMDNNIPVKIANALKVLGEEVVHLQDIFEPDVADEVWLRHVGDHGMAVITRDEKIRYNPAEKAAYIKHGVRAFFIGGQDLSICRLVQHIFIHWSDIKREVSKYDPPFALRVPLRGHNLKRINF